VTGDFDKRGPNPYTALMERRVVITGLGAVTPLGNDIGATWSALLAARSGVAGITKFDASGFPCTIGGEVKGFDPLRFMNAKEAQRTDPFIQYALAAALMAVEDAHLTLTPHGSAPLTTVSLSNGSSLRTGVLVGSGRGGVSTYERNAAAYLLKGHRGVSPFTTPMTLVNMRRGHLDEAQGEGPCLDVSTACATGSHAIGEAMRSSSAETRT